MRRWLGTLLLVTTLAFAPFGAADAEAAPTKAPTVQRLSSYFGLPTGGQTITITGSGFRKATSVSFGTVRVTPTVLSDSSLTVKVPSQSVGTVEVKVTAGTVTSQVSATGRFVYHDPAPGTAKVTPVTYTPTGLYMCIGGSDCAPIASATSGFNGMVTCQVTNSDYGHLGYLWKQEANSTYRLGDTYSGSFLEITCDGVVGRTTTWPR